MAVNRPSLRANARGQGRFMLPKIPGDRGLTVIYPIILIGPLKSGAVRLCKYKATLVTIDSRNCSHGLFFLSLLPWHVRVD